MPQVEVELIGVHLGKELAAARELFQIEELIFFETMEGFHVARVGVRGWREAVLAAPRRHICGTHHEYPTSSVRLSFPRRRCGETIQG